MQYVRGSKITANQSQCPVMLHIMRHCLVNILHFPATMTAYCAVELKCR